MSKVYWDYEKLNTELKKIEDAGYALPTRYSFIQEGRTRIIIQNDLKNAGYIRSYDEAVRYQKRVMGSNYQEYTPQQYQADIKELQDALGSQRSYQGTTKANRKQLLDILDRMNDDQLTHFRGKDFTTKELYGAVKAANDRVKESNAKSPQFYEYLVDELHSLGAKQSYVSPDTDITERDELPF